MQTWLWYADMVMLWSQSQLAIIGMVTVMVAVMVTNGQSVVHSYAHSCDMVPVVVWLWL